MKLKIENRMIGKYGCVRYTDSDGNFVEYAESWDGIYKFYKATIDGTNFVVNSEYEIKREGRGGRTKESTKEKLNEFIMYIRENMVE